MNLLKLLLLLLLFANSFKAMDCPVQKECYMQKVFNNKPLSTGEKNKLLELLRTSQISLDENGNNVLHLAAVIQEWPDLVNQLLSVRPELGWYLDAPNHEGLTPRNLIMRFQTTKQINAALDKSIETKMKESHPDYSLLEKARIVEHIRQMPSTKGNTLLHLAAGIRGFPELTQTLLTVDPGLKLVLNDTNDQGYTALHLANIKENPGAVKSLKAAGARDIL